MPRSNEWPPRPDRFPIPSGTAHIAARFELVTDPPASQFAGRLWDISVQGACVALTGYQRILVPARVSLLMLEPMTLDRHIVDAELRWSTALSHTTFVGFCFIDGPLSRTSFLRTYMRRSWTDSVRRTDLRI